MKVVYQYHDKFKLTITPTEARIKRNLGAVDAETILAFDRACLELIKDFKKENVLHTVRGQLFMSENEDGFNRLSMYFGTSPKKVLWKTLVF